MADLAASLEVLQQFCTLSVRRDALLQMQPPLGMAVNPLSAAEKKEHVSSFQAETAATSRSSVVSADISNGTASVCGLSNHPISKPQPMASQTSLKPIRTFENLQMLLDARPRKAPPTGLIRAQTLPTSPSSLRQHLNAKVAGSKAGSPAEAGEPVAAGTSSGVPVYVMLPLDCVTLNGKFRYANSKWFARALASLVCTGVRGVAIDVWWGAVEREPGQYDFGGYRSLYEAASRMGLKVQAVMSFHACGGNVGDSTQIPLPQWVLQAAEEDGDMFFCDCPRPSATGGNVNREYISLFSDDVPALAGRSPIACYTDFMAAFATEFAEELGAGIEEVIVGSGPCGELRYPSYVEGNGWRFPGVGEFQCYDRRALRSVAAAAEAAGHPEWGHGGPDDAGHYNSTPEETAFFRSWGGSWDTEYGAFFMGWYSSALLAHGERLMAAAADVFLGGDPHQESTPVRRPSSPSGGDDFVGQANIQRRSSADSSMSSASALASVVEGPPEPSASGGIPVDNSIDDCLAAMVIEPRAGDKMPRPFSAPTAMCLNTNSPATLASSTTELRWSTLADDDPRRLQNVLPELCPCPPESTSQPQLQEIQDAQALPEAAVMPRPKEQVHVTMKVAGLHWWRHTRSRAAEATAGYWNTPGRDGYDDVIKACKRHGLSMTLTCVEMCDGQHPPAALCGPEGLLRQVREGAAAAGVVLAGENALPCFTPNGVDSTALDRIVYNTQAWDPPLQEYERAATASRDEAEAALASRAVLVSGGGSSGGGSPAVDSLSLSATTEGPSSAAHTSSASLAGAPSTLSRPPSTVTTCSTGTAVTPSTSRDSLPSNISNRSSPNVAPQQRPIDHRPTWSPSEDTWRRPKQGNTSYAANGPAGERPMAVTAKLVALPIMRAFTFLRLSPEMTSPAYQGAWLRFMVRMQSNGCRPSVTPAPRLGLRPVAVPRIIPGAEWVPPPAPPPRPGSSASTS